MFFVEYIEKIPTLILFFIFLQSDYSSQTQLPVFIHLVFVIFSIIPHV